jgi:hypothetical protein
MASGPSGNFGRRQDHALEKGPAAFKKQMLVAAIGRIGCKANRQNKIDHVHGPTPVAQRSGIADWQDRSLSNPNEVAECPSACRLDAAKARVNPEKGISSCSMTRTFA